MITKFNKLMKQAQKSFIWHEHLENTCKKNGFSEEEAKSIVQDFYDIQIEASRDDPEMYFRLYLEKANEKEINEMFEFYLEYALDEKDEG